MDNSEQNLIYDSLGKEDYMDKSEQNLIYDSLGKED